MIGREKEDRDEEKSYKKLSKQKDIRQMFSAMKQKGSITMEDKIVID